MKPSPNPEKQALREQLAQQMAEFEAKHGPVSPAPIIEREEPPPCSIVSDMQRRRGRNGGKRK